MGLLNLGPDGDGTNDKKYRTYPDHEKQDFIEDVVERRKSDFPGGVDVGFVEISPEMTRTQGYAYFKPEHDYIRIAERVIENHSEEYVEMVIVHEMIHIWLHQNGRDDVSDGTKLFEWICGYLGADIDGTAPGRRDFKTMQEFLQHDSQ